MFISLNLLAFMEALLIGATLLFKLCLRPKAKPIIKPLYIGALLITPIIGLNIRNYHLFYLYLLLLPFAAGGDRRTLAGLYLAMLFQFPGLQQNYVLGPLYLGPVSTATVFTLGTLIALFMTRGRPRKTPAGMDRCAWALFGLFLYSEARGYDITVVLRLTHYWFLIFMAPYLILSRTLRSREEVEEALLVLAWSITICAVVALFESIRGWPLYQAYNNALGIQRPGLTATLFVRGGFLRAMGPVDDPTVLGMVLGVGAILAPQLKRFFLKPQIWAIYGTIVGALIFSQSRGAWMGAAAAYATILLFQRRAGVLAGIVPLLLIGWGASTLISDDSSAGAFLGRSGQAQQTAEYRSDLLHRGIEEIGKHPTGQTPEQLQISMNDMRQGQNIIDFVNSHLYIGLTVGLAGLAVWLFLWFYPVVATYRAKRSRRLKTLPLELSSSILIACFVALTFTSPIDRNPTLIAIALAAGAALLRNAGAGNAAAKQVQAPNAKVEPRQYAWT